MKFFDKRAALGLLILGSVLPLSFAASAAAAPPVPLGTTGSFAVLAGSGITNVPTSVISGNVGLSPTTGAAITGLGCVEVTGTIYKVDAAGDACFTNDPGLLTVAKSDLVLAFDNATAQTPTQDITGVNLSGQTYGAGVYSATGDILISGAAPLTLNGGGNADSVFIFQAAAGQNLSVVGTSNVVYTNGAQPCNVFWKVNSAFLSNTGFSFVGTILALQQITLTANITNNGILLSGYRGFDVETQGDSANVIIDNNESVSASEDALRGVTNGYDSNININNDSDLTSIIGDGIDGLARGYNGDIYVNNSGNVLAAGEDGIYLGTLSGNSGRHQFRRHDGDRPAWHERVHGRRLQFDRHPELRIDESDRRIWHRHPGDHQLCRRVEQHRDRQSRRRRHHHRERPRHLCQDARLPERHRRR